MKRVGAILAGLMLLSVVTVAPASAAKPPAPNPAIDWGTTNCIQYAINASTPSDNDHIWLTASWVDMHPYRVALMTSATSDGTYLARASFYPKRSTASAGFDTIYLWFTSNGYGDYLKWAAFDRKGNVLAQTSVIQFYAFPACTA